MKHTIRILIISALALLHGLAAGCSEPEYMSIDELMKPESCQTCHPKHYQEWSGSMHAYAADDPVFLAMNRRGQEETGGALGDFCVNCHAPMAVRTGATTDGLNLAELPQHLKGVTCYFCHTVSAVEGTHNNPLVLADDGVMRGGISDPVDNGKHRMAYSPLLDRESMSSSAMCGSCHDIVTPAGVHLERTFTEWQESVFSTPVPAQHLSCSKCHMVGDTDGVVADFEGVPLRKPKDHSFPGVDVALTPWPEQEAQRAGVEGELYYAIKAKLCAVPPGPLSVAYTLDNVFGGHMLPSGASADRRAWVELIAYDAEDRVIFESGVVADGQPVAEVAGEPQFWQIWDSTYDENGNVAHMFWDVRRIESNLLPPSVTNDPNDPRFYHAVTRTYDLPAVPARVVARMRVRPMGLDILDDLIASGHLDPAVRERMPTYDLAGTVKEWRAGDAFCQ